MISFSTIITCSNCGKIIPRNLDNVNTLCYDCTLLLNNNITKINYGWVCPLCNKVNNPIIMECNCNNIT